MLVVVWQNLYQESVMNLPIDKDELHVIITQLWKSRKSEAKVDALHKKLKDFSSGKIDF